MSEHKVNTNIKQLSENNNQEKHNPSFSQYSDRDIERLLERVAAFMEPNKPNNRKYIDELNLKEF